jgi:hypothetical protein
LCAAIRQTLSIARIKAAASMTYPEKYSMRSNVSAENLPCPRAAAQFNPLKVGLR